MNYTKVPRARNKLPLELSSSMPHGFKVHLYLDDEEGSGGKLATIDNNVARLAEKYNRGKDVLVCGCLLLAMSMIMVLIVCVYIYILYYPWLVFIWAID